MIKPDLTPHNIAIWNSITKEQMDVITILVQNYYETDDDVLFYEVIGVDDVDAGNYTSQNQYIIWRSLTLHQKQLIISTYYEFMKLNDADLRLKYDEEEVYNMDIPYEVFILYNLFTTMNSGLSFKFFNNLNNN